MLKLDLGTIKNESAASDLPPEGPPKERWVDLCKISMIWRAAYVEFGASIATKSVNGNKIGESPEIGESRENQRIARKSENREKIGESRENLRIATKSENRDKI